MKVVAYEDFESSFSGHLNHLSATRRRRLLRALYRLAKRAEALEKLRQILHTELFARFAARREMARRSLKQVENAIASIDRALKVYSERPPLIYKEEWIQPVTEAQRLLTKAKEDLADDYTSLKSAARLAFKTNRRHTRYPDFNDVWFLVQEKATRGQTQKRAWANYADFLSDVSELEHLRSRAADQWFMGVADDVLREQAEITVTKRWTLIAKLFLAAFGERVEVAKIKTALVRRTKKPRMSVKA